MRRTLSAFVVVLLVAGAARAATIRPGDVLKITVHANAEFSGAYTVAPDGTIDYPLLVDESIANVTTGELARDLTLRLAKYIDNPLVSVSVMDNPEITVTALGEIVKPGPVTAYRGVTVQEVLTLAGGPTKRADLSQIKILPKGRPDRDAVFFDLQRFLDSGMVAGAPVLDDGDRMILLGKKRSTKVKVIGAVKSPGFYELEEDMNLFEIIYLCGGPAEKADLSRVRRLFKNDGRTLEEVVNLQQFIDRGSMDEIPQVHEGDVIIVYAKWFDWMTLLTVLNNTLLFIVTIQAFRGVFNQ